MLQKKMDRVLERPGLEMNNDLSYRQTSRKNVEQYL